MTESNDTRPQRFGWCSACGRDSSFHADGTDWACDTCETLATDGLREQAEASTPEQQGEGAASPAPVLINDLDHIRLQLTGPWSNDDLKALAEDLTLSADGAKEGGLGLSFFAVKKSAAALSRSAGNIIIPFRDRHGKIMATPPLSLGLGRLHLEGK